MPRLRFAVGASFALAMLLGPTGVARAAAPCKPDYVTGGMFDGNGVPLTQLSRLQIVIVAAKNWQSPPATFVTTAPDRIAAWATLRDQAVRELAACSKFVDPFDPPTGRFMRAAWREAGFEQSFIEAARAAHLADPVLQPVLSPGGAVPAPQRLQFGLSQVVSGGQPGMLASASGLLDANNRDSRFLRHASLAFSALVIQPTGPASSTMGAPAPAKPQIGAVDLGLLYSTRDTLYDWTDNLTSIKTTTADEDAFALDAWNITNDLLRELSTTSTPGAPAPADVVQIVNVAGRAYFDATEPKLKIRVATPNPGTVSGWAIRFRASPDATFVPELPDLLSLQATWSGDAGQDAATTGAYFRFKWAVAGSISALPTEKYATWDAGAITDTLGGVADASLGLAASVPTAGEASPTRLEAAAIGRFSKHAGDGQGAGNFSGGGHVQIGVPVGGGISLVGTYTARYEEARHWITTAGFTLVKSIK